MNRRSFLKSVGVGAGAAAVGTGINREVISALTAPSAVAQPVDPVWHVLNRVTNGPRPGQVDAVKKMGVQAYLEQQLAPDKIDDSASEARLCEFTTIVLTETELLDLGLKNPGPVVVALDSATVSRAIFSERQLFEVMVNFWSEHFSIWQEKETDKYFKTPDDRNVVRKYALGKFRDILGASAKSPAMLIYLDNAQSEKAHPNENYGREVMELHTVTIGNYTETDVKEVARCFTGWSIQTKKEGKAGQFIYRAKMHDNGAKTVIGHAIPAGGGQQDGETVLDILAAHPATAEHIASKLCRRFIADDPPQNVVTAAKQAYLTSGGDIPTILRVIFAAPEFLNAQPKYKRPWEFVISTFRALDVQIDKLQPAVLAVLNNMGQLPFNYVTPDGYTDYAQLWEGNLLLRWNLALNTLYGKTAGVKVDLNALVKSQNVKVEPTAVIQYFAQHLYGRPMTQDESTALLAFLNRGGAPDLTTDAGRQRINDTIAMMLSAPAFQYR